MSLRAGRFIRRTLLAALAMGVASNAAGQDAAAPASAPGASFLPRADFHFQWWGLVTPDPRFTWSGLVGYDIDVVDYGSGRLGFSGDYEAVLGRERRRYDLNQGNYRFRVTLSRRIGATEVAALVEHVSRHLTDRDNAPAISWNFVGVRASRQFTAGSAIIDAELDAGRAMQQAFVDYLWTSDLRIAMRHKVGDRMSLIAATTGKVVTVNHLVRGERVCGARIEGGMRIRGDAAALEMFAGYERRIDAFPTDRFRVRFFTLGFRIVSR